MNENQKCISGSERDQEKPMDGASIAPEHMVLIARDLLTDEDDEVARYVGRQDGPVPEWSYALAVEALQAARLPNPPASPVCYEFYAPEAQSAGHELGRIICELRPAVGNLVRGDSSCLFETDGKFDDAIEAEVYRILDDNAPWSARLRP